MYSKTEIQLCVIHQIRSSVRCVASKNQKEFMADLKSVYKALSNDLAEKDMLEYNEPINQDSNFKILLP